MLPGAGGGARHPPITLSGQGSTPLSPDWRLEKAQTRNLLFLKRLTLPLPTGEEATEPVRSETHSPAPSARRPSPPQLLQGPTRTFSGSVQRDLPRTALHPYCHPQVSGWRTLCAQNPLCPASAHLFPFPGENQRSAAPSGTERSSPGSPPSPAFRNSAKGGGFLSCPAGAGRPRGMGAGFCLERTGEQSAAVHVRSGPGEGGSRGRRFRWKGLSAPSLPTRRRRGAAEDPQRLVPYPPRADLTCLARAMGTVLPSSFKQRLIRSLLLFSITLWETRVLCEQKFANFGSLCAVSGQPPGCSCLPTGLPSPQSCPCTCSRGESRPLHTWIKPALPSHPRWRAPFQPPYPRGRWLPTQPS